LPESHTPGQLHLTKKWNWNSSHFEREIFGQMGWGRNSPGDG
jgi:hypothetical protein